MNFADRLDAAIARAGNPCLLGIDPHFDLLPDEFAVARDPRASRAERAGAVAEFALDLVDLARGRVAAVKPQSAFFEELGADGVAAWERVVSAAREAGLIVVGDVKRSDIASTAAAYGRAFLGAADTADPPHLCDAITVNPYLGSDSVEPLVETCVATGRGLFVLVRTSNPGSAEFQLHGEPPLWTRVAAAVERWGSDLHGACGLSSVGAVVGATHAQELAELRRALPHAPLLLPGYGAQGASAADLSPAFLPGGRGVLVNSSRGIAFAHRSRPDLAWKDAAVQALEAMIAAVARVAT